MTSAAPVTSPLDRAAPPGARRQRTIASQATVSGKGLMLGVESTLTILPAPPDHGIVFERADLERPVIIPALVSNVIPNSRRTTLKAGDVTIETVEHCMSALRGLGIDNALLRLNGPELPCGDGSAMPFVDAIRPGGVAEQDAPRRTFRLLEPIVVEEGDASIAAIPADSPAGMRVMYDLDYGPNSSRIPHQAWSYDPGRDDYVAEIAPARTFSLREEAGALWQAGLCRHLTPRDVLVIGDDGPIDNAFRFPDEPVRHKLLDCIGDLSLVGTVVECQVIARRSGHGLNRQLGMRLLRAVQKSRQARALVEGRAMDARAIGRLMPHRFPMLLVDRVLELEPGRRATGVKNVTINEPFFQGHFPGHPIMPGVLIVEAMAQVGGVLLMGTVDAPETKVVYFMSLDNVKFRRPVKPGDQLRIEVDIVQLRSTMCRIRGVAKVDDVVVCEADMAAVVRDR